VTEFEKYIYNTHLRVGRSALNKPFRLRKDFDDLEGTEVEVHLSKLAVFFSKWKHIKVDLFFEAPYRIYPGTTAYYLDYYNSQKAIKAYSLYIANLKREDPDTERQLKFVVEAFKFIKTFCSDKKIKIEDYCNYSSGVVYDFIPHLKEFNVSAYALFAFKDFEKNMLIIEPDTLKFILGDEYVSNFYVFRNKYLESKKCKTLSELAYKKITTIIKNN